MKLKLLVTGLFVLTAFQNSFSQAVTIQVDAAAGRKAISPYIFGKNNNISDNPSSPTTHAEWQMFRDAGLHYMRENNGNNATKYNWRKKISSHPDWYNNNYNHNWDYAAKTLGDSMPGTQGMWAFQLIGYAATTAVNNFDDWAYNGSTGWSGTCQNLDGGGTVNSAGGCNALADGNTNLYLEPWNEDSTTNILTHWFGGGGLGLNQNYIKYWSMDNEPDGWDATHDDVMPTLPNAEAFMQLYFKVAKKARAKFPNIKLTGPVPESEWQWYNWNNSKITVGGTDYNWLEFFIKRCAEEQTASGVRLLDVIDIHSYPGETRDSDIVQAHRVFFDTLYDYPGANGVKTTDPSGWNNSITKEYVFGRVNKWLLQYMGSGHGVTCAVSESGINGGGTNVTSSSYASLLGTFADNGVEFFTPWDWFPGMWETMHLFSRYGKNTRVSSTSTLEHYLTAYSSINTAQDSVTVILVNRSLAATHATTVNLTNFTIPNGSYTTKQLHSLPSTETFVSHTSNALLSNTVSVNSNSFSISLPALSITAVVLKGTSPTSVQTVESSKQFVVYPNPTNSILHVELKEATGKQNENYELSIRNLIGEELIHTTNFPQTSQVDVSNLPNGVYFISVRDSQQKAASVQRFIIQK
jgi:hypothetical protein